MKPVLPLLLLVCATFFSCQPEEPLLPYFETEIVLQTCNLTSQAVVQYREAMNGNDPFYYLSLLNEGGNEVGEVYTSSIQEGEIQVGEKISITYHYKVKNDISYVAACGDDPDHQASKEDMAEIEICKMDEGKS